MTTIVRHRAEPAANPELAVSRHFKLQEICDLLSVDYDGARYALARGILPPGIDADPGRGRHRIFSQTQAFYLATALKLKEVGLSLPRICEIVPLTRKIQEWSCNGGFEANFAPFNGGLQSRFEWWLDIGDARWFRIRTNSSPSQEGMEITHWVTIKARREVREAKPAIIISVDLSEIARLLDGAPTPCAAPRSP